MTARQDALDLLKADRHEVTGLFEAFEGLRERRASDAERSAVVEQICLLLSVHTQLEEELFYPAVRQAIGSDTWSDAARANDSGTKARVARISLMTPSDPQFDAEVAMLGGIVARRAHEEHSGLFPKLRKTNLDLMALGARLQQRKSALLAEYREMLNRSAQEDESADPVGRPVPPRPPNERR